MHRRYRWAVIGTGTIARKFLSDLSRIPEAEVYAVCSRSLSRAREFGEDYGASAFYDDVLAMAEDQNVDIVYVATPHTEHFSNAITCMENGKAVLVEKPMAVNSEQARKMMECARRNNVFLMEAMWSRLFPAFRTLVKWVAMGRMGQIRNISADFGFFNTHGPEERLLNPALGGGATLDVGPYVIWAAASLVGLPAKVQAMGRLGETGVDEHTIINLQHSMGVTSQLMCGIDGKTPQQLIITGTEGWIWVPDFWHADTLIYQPRGESDEEVLSFPYEGLGYQFQINEVMDCVSKGFTESPRVPLSMSVSIMEVMDEVRRQIGVRYAMD